MSVPAPSAPPLPRSSPRICGAAFSEGLGFGVAALPHPPGPSLLSSASEAADTHWFSRLSPPRAGFLPDEKWRSAGFRPRRCGDFRRKHRTGCSPVPRPPRRPPPRPAELWLRTPRGPGGGDRRVGANPARYRGSGSAMERAAFPPRSGLMTGSACLSAARISPPQSGEGVRSRAPGEGRRSCPSQTPRLGRAAGHAFPFLAPRPCLGGADAAFSRAPERRLSPRAARCAPGEGPSEPGRRGAWGAPTSSVDWGAMPPFLGRSKGPDPGCSLGCR